MEDTASGDSLIGGSFSDSTVSHSDLYTAKGHMVQKGGANSQNSGNGLNSSVQGGL